MGAAHTSWITTFNFEESGECLLDNVPSEISETVLEGDDLKDLLDNGAAGRVSAGLDRRLPRMFGGIVACLFGAA